MTVNVQKMLEANITSDIVCLFLEDKEATIDYTSWPRLKISDNTEVRGNTSCIAKVEVGIDWIARIEVGMV